MPNYLSDARVDDLFNAADRWEALEQLRAEEAEQDRKLSSLRSDEPLTDLERWELDALCFEEYEN